MNEIFRIRASSMWGLLDCALRWKKQNIDGLRLPSTAPAVIGTAVHASTAAFDKSERDHDGLTIDDTADIAVNTILHPNEEVDWAGSKEEKAIATALHVHATYCTKIAPTQTYTEIEHTLRPFHINMGDGIVFELTGTLDRIYIDDHGNQGVGDVKTGGRAVAPDGTVVLGKHLPQLGEYELLAEQEFGRMTLPPVIIGLHTGGNGRAGIGAIYGARDALVGNTFEPGILTYAAQYFKSGLFPPNPGSFLCSAKYCPHYARCIYHG